MMHTSPTLAFVTFVRILRIMRTPRLLLRRLAEHIFQAGSPRFQTCVQPQAAEGRDPPKYLIRMDMMFERVRRPSRAPSPSRALSALCLGPSDQI